MKHLQPYYKKAVRQILAENGLSQQFQVDTLYAALCADNDPRKAAKMLIALFAEADFDWPKLDLCRRLADKHNLPHYRGFKIKDKYRLLIQSIVSRAAALRIIDNSREKPAPSFIWQVSITQAQEGDDVLAEMISLHYPLPELPPFFPGDLTTVLNRLVKQ